MKWFNLRFKWMPTFPFQYPSLGKISFSRLGRIGAVLQIITILYPFIWFGQIYIIFICMLVDDTYNENKGLLKTKDWPYISYHLADCSSFISFWTVSQMILSSLLYILLLFALTRLAPLSLLIPLIRKQHPRVNL